MASDQLRLFVAIELPGEVRDTLGRLQHELQLRGLEQLRWVRPEGIHLTLKFLGDTRAERVPEISAVLARVASGMASHELTLGALGTFGGARRPRVLWVDLGSDVKAATDLQQLIDDGLSAIGIECETRGFSPHLTLARVRPETARDVAAPLAEAVSTVSTPKAAITVREVSLVRSILGPGGAVYERVAAFPLGGHRRG